MAYHCGPDKWEPAFQKVSDCITSGKVFLQNGISWVQTDEYPTTNSVLTTPIWCRYYLSSHAIFEKQTFQVTTKMAAQTRTQKNRKHFRSRDVMMSPDSRGHERDLAGPENRGRQEICFKGK